MMLLVLPSSLRVPQSPPMETLEFAPVPATHDQPPLATGPSSLGLGSSTTTRGDGGGGSASDPGLPPPPPPPGEAARPVTKRCVGAPPRQTEDPLSPPCVAHFEGDNGGAVATGVTASEVRVVFYFDGSDYFQVGSSRRYEAPPNGSINDLAEPETEDDFVFDRVLRRYMRYFNERYQTYGRSVRFLTMYSSGDSEDATSPESRRGDAVRLLTEVQPFAVVSYAAQNNRALIEVLADGGALVIAGNADIAPGLGERDAFFRRYPGSIWSYAPSIEARAQMFVTYVCRKVVPHPVSFSGNGDAGEVRVLGLLRIDPESQLPAHEYYADLIHQGVEDCGGRVTETGIHGFGCYLQAPSCMSSGALENMARFQDAGVTTILWAGQYDTGQSQAAATLDYRPEWLVAGDETGEINLIGQMSEQSVWQHARNTTTFPAVASVESRQCVQAIREADPSTPLIDAKNYACAFYKEVRQLFTGVQVSGPELTITNFDKGFHAIPASPSHDPTVPACFYRPGDYTCVKDAQAQWWDPEGTDPNTGADGCWRMMEAGRPYLIGAWPEGDVEAQRDPADDPCNLQGAALT